jgi:hypothetical protein
MLYGGSRKHYVTDVTGPVGVPHYPAKTLKPMPPIYK